MASIKECFTSRFKGGVIVEMDYSQLEVIGAAEVTGDPNMAEDILRGIDSHSQSASWLSKHSYDEVRDGYLAGDSYFTKLRKGAKAPRFELMYGAGAKSIAENNNIHIEVAKGFVERYYARYSVLKEYQDHIRETVEGNAFPIEKVTDIGGYPLHGGVFPSVTGRSYYFEEQLAPEFMRKRGEYTSFSPTQFKNYYSQGFATGDVVPEMLGRVMRKLIEEDALHILLPINTVHDSIIFDYDITNTPHFKGLLATIRETMEDVPTAMKDRFGLNLTLPYKVDVEIGDNWNEMKTL
jgi:DNA polymerase-1